MLVKLVKRISPLTLSSSLSFFSIMFNYQTLSAQIGRLKSAFVLQSVLFPNSFLFRSSFTRNYSKVECSLVQLASDLEFVCLDILESTKMSIPRLRLAEIKHQILSDSYILSPLLVKFIKMEDLSKFIKKYLPYHPDRIMLGASPSSNRLRVMMPNNKEDAIVLLALSRTLLRVSKGCLPRDCYRLEDSLDEFYSSLAQIGKVDRLIKCDLMLSARTIHIGLVEEKIRHYVADDSVYRLISSFLNLPILDENGNNRQGLAHFDCIPEVGEITNVLLDIILMETFDLYFPKRFPGIRFMRFVNEVYILTNGKDPFDEKDVLKLLKDLSLIGTIKSIGPNDDPLLCFHKKLIYLGTDNKVYLDDPKEA